MLLINFSVKRMCEMTIFFIILSNYNIGHAEKLKNWLILVSVFLISTWILFSQNYIASPAIWVFPNCNPQSTNHQIIKSKPQDLSNFVIKWRTNSISGDLQPLVGNIINDPKIDSNFTYAPNEIVAIRGGKFILVDSRGLTHKTNSSAIPYINNISFLFDTLSNTFYPFPNSTLLLGIETIEFENQKDTLLYTFIAGYDAKGDTIKLIKRIVVDQRAYKPNLFGSLRPFFGKKYGNDFLLYVSSNIYNPIATQPDPVSAPFFRGFSIFPSSSIVNTFPLPDITDNIAFRVTLGPEVAIAPPSLINFGPSHWVLFPNYQTPNLDVNIPNSISLSKTNPTKSYLLCYNLVNNQIRQVIPPLELTSLLDPNGKRPQIRPFFLILNDSSSPDSLFILVAEDYRGIDTSIGTSALHLFDGNFSALTFPNDPFSPTFKGSKNVVWALATGNVDGNPANQWLPYYPNNPGNEIIATLSSLHHSVPDNKLFLLRYNNGQPIPKPTPPGAFLFPFDTICTFKTSGWVAAVNDIDGATDEKDEIILVDGSKIRILRIRDYNSFEFKSGKPFDTVWSYEFKNETIFKVLVVDLDGDEMNDLIVTTNNFTYLIGSPLPRLIEVVSPKYSFNPLDICIGDTIVINIRTKSLNEEKINLRFVPILNGIHQFSKSRIKLANFSINNFSTKLTIFVDTSFLNQSGIFYIENANDSTQIFDSTEIFNFFGPNLTYDNSILNVYFFDNVRLSFTTECADSVVFEYSVDGISWQYAIGEKIISPNQTTQFGLPCLNIFDCKLSSSIADVLIRNKIFKGEYTTITSPVVIKVKPRTNPISFANGIDFCGSKLFTWNPFDQQCDSVEILISIDGGVNFSLMDKIFAKLNLYEWKCRTNLPDSIIFRFCCLKSCQMTDTIVYIPKPKYIQTVAPNPFKPSLGNAEINYIIDKETTATIRILDENNRLVRELVKDAPRLPNIIYCERWDGKSDYGDVVAPGLYYLLLELSFGNKEIFPIFVK